MIVALNKLGNNYLMIVKIKIAVDMYKDAKGLYNQVRGWLDDFAASDMKKDAI